ncbi:MAG: VapC toxin family PIN domain ribonuclease [Actinophytocola sp.]|nr:VapC toxin family PIN domain ribonuclease [Actinophytocola sp.]
MIRYLIDSSGLWRVLRDDEVRAAWADVLAGRVVGSCHPQRAEFRRSARDRDEYDDMTEMFAALYPDVPVPKTVWSWVDAAQHRLVRAGVHRAFSLVDLLVCATAAIRGLVVLHDDNDFATAARHLADVAARRVYDLPGQ